MAPDTTSNSYYLEIDGTTCGVNVGDSAIAANTWTWVDYQGGNSSTKVNVTLTAGSHTISMIGKEADVELDRIILTTDTACVPTGTGDNCGPVDTTVPTVSVTAPTAGATVSGSSVTLSANASDDVGVAGVQFKVDGSNTGAEDTTSAYSITWNSTGVANGSHSITAVARDAAGNTTTSSPVTVTVNNTSGQPDLIVTDVTWSPASPKPGDNVTFSAVIKNQGSAATPGSTIHGVLFSVNGTSVNWSDTNTATLAAGASRTLTANSGTLSTATWTAGSAGSYTVNANVDDVNRITESNESNNTFNKTLTVASATVKPADIDKNGVVDITDLSYLLSSYGQTTTTCTTNSSFTCDIATTPSSTNGKIDIFDLSLLLSGYGK
jgi:hypothetical protein